LTVTERSEFFLLTETFHQNCNKMGSRRINGVVAAIAFLAVIHGE